MTPTSLKKGPGGRRCGSITASLQKLTEEEGHVQVAVTLPSIGREARKVIKTWNLLVTERKDTGIKGVNERFNNYCNPRKM